MPGKLPSDFDPAGYSAAYPDVALSGLSPKDHYLRFGRGMGRSPAGTTDKTIVKSAQPSSDVPDTSPKPEAPSLDAKALELPARLDPLIERPADFDPSRSIPAPAGARTAGDHAVNLESLANGLHASGQDQAGVRGPLLAYARMLPNSAGGAIDDCDGDAFCAEIFRTGPTRIENAWFPARSTLRLMIGGGSGDRQLRQGWALRAYQARPTTPGQFEMAGQGVRVPALGPVFCDVELVHPLMPLLLELSDEEDVARGFALLPFPSLLPGGMHAAELMALQTEANPMDGFWSLSDVLLREFLGHPDWPERSITSLVLKCAEPMDEPPLSGELREWIEALFGLSVNAAGASQTGGRLSLLLPANSVPTVSALVSRRLATASPATAPFLVAEPQCFRPRWSVALPTQWQAEARAPVLMPAKKRAKKPANLDLEATAVPIHLAISFRPDDGSSINPAELEVPGPPGTNSGVAGRSLTIVLEAQDPARVEALLPILRAMAGQAELDLIVRFSGSDDTALRVSLDRICGSDAWAEAAYTDDLRDLARKALGETLLTISDRVILSDTSVPAVICDLLRDNSDAGSASCVLLGEIVVKKQIVLQPASGGLFPAQVSFASAPRLGFAEPDVLQALAGLTYPVVANTMLLTAWRTQALAALPKPDGPVPPSAADIRLGLDLMAAGYRNLCTTQARARLAGSYQRRDAIDPIGSAYVDPRRWEDIFGKVTVLRELI